MRTYLIRIFSITAATALLNAASAFGYAENAQNFTYQGQLLDGENAPFLDPSVVFVLSIYSPGKACLLYEETQTVNTASTNGIYSIIVGSPTGAAKRTGNDPGLRMATIFTNDGSQIRAAGTQCTSGYTSAARDIRVMEVTVTPSTTGTQVVLSPDEMIDAAPQAWSAETFQGIPPGSFLQLSGSDAVIPIGKGLKVNGAEVINSSGQWVGVPTGLIGPTGATGTAGSNGTTGATGPTGTAGATGIAGATGANGSTGSAGLTGAAGATGATGSAGISGPNGSVGSTGADGSTGPTGSDGPTGADGSAGATGPDSSTTGATGATGATGTSQWTISGTTAYYTTGKVGIGTTTPSTGYKLDVVGGNIKIANTQDDTTDPSLYLNDGLSGTTKVNIKISPSLGGNVTTATGISVNSPTANSYTMTSYRGVILDGTNGIGSGTNKGLEITNVATATNNYSIYSSAPAQSYFAGSFGIGVTGSSYKLDVNGEANLSSGNVFKIAGTTICSSSGCTASSDRRLKENISSLEDPLENILQLQGVQYDWKDKKWFSDQHQIGMIAQDVERVYPEVVLTDPNTGLKAVAYDHLVAPVIEAMKDMNEHVISLFAENENQAKEIKSLQADNASLDARMETIERTLK
jgi:hypothetical protein